MRIRMDRDFGLKIEGPSSKGFYIIIYFLLIKFAANNCIFIINKIRIRNCLICIILAILDLSKTIAIRSVFVPNLKVKEMKFSL